MYKLKLFKFINKIIPFLKKNEYSSEPNILLTDTCNQNCEYCFARNIMKATPKKHMAIEDFQKIVGELKQMHVKTIRLLGGEPTLHPKFEQIITMSVNNFDKVFLFTNGLFSKEVEVLLEKNSKRMLINININTPGFEDSPVLRKIILHHVNKFALCSTVILSFTIDDFSNNYQRLLVYFSSQQLQQMHFSFSIAKKDIVEKPYFNKQSYLKLGKYIIDTVSFLKEKKVLSITMDCGLQKAMFNQQDLIYLKNNVNIKGWGCEGKWGSYDINSNLDVFRCFPKSKFIITRQNYKNLKNLKIPTTKPCL